MGYASNRIQCIFALILAVPVWGCDSGGNDSDRVRDASSIEANDRDAGSGLEEGGRNPGRRDGGITIDEDEDAGSVNNCDVRTEFRCGDGRCIIRARQCNQIVDCEDRSDEANCGGRCGVGDFVCNNGACVTPSARCDGVGQCADGSDELGCGTPCAGFRCGDSTCIPTDYRCDQVPDCADRSDEAACPKRCDVVPAPVAGWNGVPRFTQAQLMQCIDFCGQNNSSCYTEANCPGYAAFNECFSDEVLACSVNAGGACRARYQDLTCCADELCGDDLACVEASCAVEVQQVRDCIENDDSCADSSIFRCLAP